MTEQESKIDTDFEPNDIEETILDLMKEGREEGEPWGRVTPFEIRQEFPNRFKQNINYYLQNLVEAGWIKNPLKGIYVFVCDPREECD